MKQSKVRILSALRLAALFAIAAGCSKETAPDSQEGRARAAHHRAAEAKPASSGPTCAVHGAPKAQCFICDASLRDPGRLWCKEHKRYEDRCWDCHPELQDKNRLYCNEHGLYEDECFVCHPELKSPARPTQSPQAAVLMCEEHGVAEAECGICRPDVVAGLEPGQGTKVRLPSTDSARMVGVQAAAPETGPMSEAVECLAEVSFNENKLAQIVAPVGGIVQSVEVDLGSRVEEGQTVAKLWSASIAEAVAKAVLTHQNLERERRLRAERVTSEKDLQQAEAEHRAACQQLRMLGFTEEQIDELGKKPSEAVLMEVQAPFAGEIVERRAVRGSLVEAGRPLFVVADRSVMWANLSIPEAALARVETGQKVELVLDALPGRTFVGKLTWIGPAVDGRTRMAQGRAEISNPNRVLRDKMFARARIVTRTAEDALLVPASAVQHVGGKPLVFVKLGDDLFEARVVTLGPRLNGRQEVLAGLNPDENVVVNHGFALKSQLLASRLGAGCAHE